jgi:hypothetical protein
LQAAYPPFLPSLVHQPSRPPPLLDTWSPTHRLIRRFAATRNHDFEQTAALLREYAAWRTKVGLEDDSLSREPGVFRELRKRHTMRLLDPSGATRYQQQQQEQQQEQQQQSLTFLELHSPSMWPTARDRDGCPVVYTNMEQYQRGASKAVGAVQV